MKWRTLWRPYGCVVAPPVLLICVLLLALALFAPVQPTQADDGDTGFTNLVTTGNVRAGTYVLVGTDLRLKASSTITLTNGATLTPVGSYQPIAAAGAIGFGEITADAAGTLLLLTNVTANAITITDTGTLKLGGNRALGQFDTLMLLSDGTNWLEYAYVNN